MEIEANQGGRDTMQRKKKGERERERERERKRERARDGGRGGFGGLGGWGVGGLGGWGVGGLGGWAVGRFAIKTPKTKKTRKRFGDWSPPFLLPSLQLLIGFLGCFSAQFASFD